MKNRYFLSTSLLLLSFFWSIVTTAQSVYTSAAFDGRSINVTLPVGSTVGSGSVSPAGAATYLIPLVLPPGTNGIQPSLSVNYNSFAADGPLGRGWSIAGLSMISRMGRSQYFDGEIKPISLTNTDRFALDGGVLLPAGSGTYGSNGYSYQSEAESFSTIISYGTIGSGPAWFKVTSKDGIVMEYGNSADSRFTTEDGSEVLLWRLNRITYQDGNYIEYKYVNSDRDPRIDEIKYTGNQAAGLSPYQSIKFSYKSRNTPITVYVGSSAVTSKYLLDKITITVEGAAFKTYQFNQGWNEVNHFLNEVVERSDIDGSSLNSIIFKYGDAPTEVIHENTSIPSGNDIQVFGGDIDGDGVADLITGAQGETKFGITYFSSFKVYKRTTSGYVQTVSQSLPVNYTLVQDVKIPNSRTFLASDFTGDGNDDILALNISYNSTEAKLENVTIYESTNNGTAFTPRVRSIQPNYYRIHPNGKFFYAGDFNGDGVSEYLTILGNTLNTYLPFLCTDYLTGGACGGISVNGPTSFPVDSWYNADQIHILDFNGDGKSDILLIKDNNSEIFTFSGLEATRIYSSTSFPVKSQTISLADFNGDGKVDILAKTFPNPSVIPSFVKAISTGVDFVQSPLTVSLGPAYQPSTGGSYVYVGDYNGDGRSDFIHEWFQTKVMSISTGGSEQHEYWGKDIFYSKGDGFYVSRFFFQENVQPLSLLAAFATEVTSYRNIPTDINGDGRTDLVSSSGNLLSYDLFNKDGKELLLEKVKNGFNHVTEWNYRSLIPDGGVYTKGASTAFPLNTIQPSLLVASALKVQDGIGGIATSTYSYEGAKHHRGGKGFLGFTKFTTTDVVGNTRTVAESQINTSFYVLTPYKETSTLTSTNTLIQETTTNIELLSLGGRRYLSRINGTTVNKALEGRTVTTTNTSFDSYGNITASTVNNNNVETTSTSYTYQAYVTSIPNRLTSTTVTRTRSGQPAYAVTSTYGYNGLGQMTTKTDFSGQSKAVTTTYGYNNLGNQTSTKVSPSGMTERTVSSVFDAKGRYPLTTTNELGQSVSVTYEARWGRPLTSTDIAGQATSFEYDAWGRMKKTTLPEGYSMDYLYGWDLANGAIHYSLTQHPGKPDIKIWFDVLGREIRKQTEGMSGAWITEKKSYDAKGNIQTVTQPFLPGEPEVSTATTYDELNRPVSSTHPVLGTTTTSYSYTSGNLNVTTTSPANRQSSKTTDATGQTVSVTDNGGTLTYTYYSHGGLKEIKRDNQVIASNEYDEYGRQTKLVDANAGTTTYLHNALGQLTDQTNANGQSTSMQYDLLGRMTSRAGQEGTTTNEYFTSGSGIGQLKKSTGFAGNTTEYTYDNYGRVGTQTETIDGNAYAVTLSYNIYGDVTTKSFSDGFGTNHAYDGNGYITTIKNSSNSVTFYTTGSLNGLGQIKSYSLGNGKSSQISYESGFPTRYYTDGIQDLNLTWEYTTGNLLKRKDNIKGREEDFTYDGLDRLLTAKVVGLTTQTMTYQLSGNIASKTDVGSYSYLSTKPNAVEYVSNAAGVIPSLQQTVTYTPFMQPQVLSENGYELTYTYGEDYQRIKGVLKLNGTTLRTRYYLTGYERNGSQYVHYINSPAGLVAIAVRENGSESYYYTYTDHLESILTVTNAAGSVAVEQNFDAWGRRRNPTTWDYANVPARPDWLYRGYTGHEHLDEFGLINMNGRLYDPVLGRMLSPDNFIQEPEFTQNFNRYSYALNNPLKYTDPDGQLLFIPILIGAVVGGVVNVALHANRIHSWGDGLAAFGIGAVGGGLAVASGGAAISLVGLSSTGVLSGAVAGIAGSAVGGAITGTGNAVYFGDPFGVKEWATGVAIGGVLGGLGGGAAALVKGRNFWTGAPRAMGVNGAKLSSFSFRNNGMLREQGWQRSIIDGRVRYSLVRGENVTLVEVELPNGKVVKEFAGVKSGEVVFRNNSVIGGIDDVATEVSTNLLKPLGLGSTGRTTAANLVEQMAMEDVMANPHLGKVVMTGMKDSRWPGWSKMQYSVETQKGVKAVVHYVGKWENGVLKAVDDFKFK